MHNPLKQNGQPAWNKARLGVMLYAYSLDHPDQEPTTQFLGLGTKADLSFAPSADGKGLVAIPNAPATTAPKSTNWGLYLKSLYDCGLPAGVFQNNVGVLDGIWVQTDLVPEPEERKGFAQNASTSEAGEELNEQGERKGSGKVPVVVEILEGGKPWEGTGGFPQTAVPAAAPVAAPARPTAVPPRQPVRPAAVAPPPQAAPAEGEADVESAAQAGITSILEDPANANGCTKLKVRTGTFKYVKAAYGDAMAQQVTALFDSGDDAVNAVLAPLGYKLQGQNVVPA
jgi:hypothetical protein